MIYSDNTSNFKAAEKELRQMHRKIDFKAVQNANISGAKSMPINWQFSTEKAAWTNGITERLVQSVKKALRPTLLREIVSFERLEAILIGIEGILNCRPLATSSSADADLATPITPSLLMYGKNMLPLEDPPRSLRTDESHMPDITKSMKVRQRFLNMFWRQWRKEYLTRFDVAKKWNHPKDNKLDIGDVVVIIDPDSLRNDWRLAKVVEPTFSKSHVLNGAKVRTANGKVLQRHLRNLAMLETTAVFKGAPRPEQDQPDIPATPSTINVAQSANSSAPATSSTLLIEEGGGDSNVQCKQYLGVDGSAGRLGLDQAEDGRASGPLGGNDGALKESVPPPSGAKRKRGSRRSRKKFKH